MLPFMPDYTRVATYLAARREPRVTLTFDQVEAILGEPLPLVARVMGGWWSGVSAQRHQQGRAWRAVGWRSEHVDIYAETVTFVRDGAHDTESQD